MIERLRERDRETLRGETDSWFVDSSSPSLPYAVILERQTETETETDRQRDRETQREKKQRETQRERQRDSERETDRVGLWILQALFTLCGDLRETDRDRDRQTDREIERLRDRDRETQRERETDRQTELVCGFFKPSLPLCCDLRERERE